MACVDVRLHALRTGRSPAARTALAHRVGLTWPRLPAAAEVASISVGYAAYALVRLVLRAGNQTAFAHAAQLWRAERRLHLNIEPYLNHLAAAHPGLAEPVGYYYGLLHFIVTPLVLGWLYLRRRAAFPRLRSALVLATASANVVFWTWPLAPPRFFVPGMTDVLVTHDILGAADPRGPSSLVNLYAAMPSLHVAWAAWCALALVTTARSRWRQLAWLYPAATTFVVLASANHFLLDIVGGLAVTGLGVLAAVGGKPLPLWAHTVKQSRGAPVRSRFPGPTAIWASVCSLVHPRGSMRRPAAVMPHRQPRLRHRGRTTRRPVRPLKLAARRRRPWPAAAQPPATRPAWVAWYSRSSVSSASSGWMDTRRPDRLWALAAAAAAANKGKDRDPAHSDSGGAQNLPPWMRRLRWDWPGSP